MLLWLHGRIFPVPANERIHGVITYDYIHRLKMIVLSSSFWLISNSLRTCAVVSTSYALRENPKEALLCMGAAVHLVDASFHANIISVVSCALFFHSLDFDSWCFLQAKCSCYGSDEGWCGVDKDNIRLYNQTETIIALKNFKVAILVRIWRRAMKVSMTMLICKTMLNAKIWLYK